MVFGRRTTMGKRHTAEEIVGKLRQIEVLCGQGKALAEAIRAIRSDNGPEFVAAALREWIAAVGAKTAHIQPGSPWENGYVASLNGKLRDELLNGEIFYSLAEARIVIEQWRKYYNTIRPHSSLGYRPPAPEVVSRPASHDPSPVARPASPPRVRPRVCGERVQDRP
jgi:transposase InsO family protein